MFKAISPQHLHPKVGFEYPTPGSWHWVVSAMVLVLGPGFALFFQKALLLILVPSAPVLFILQDGFGVIIHLYWLLQTLSSCIADFAAYWIYFPAPQFCSYTNLHLPLCGYVFVICSSLGVYTKFLALLQYYRILICSHRLPYLNVLVLKTNMLSLPYLVSNLMDITGVSATLPQEKLCFIRNLGSHLRNVVSPAGLAEQDICL